MERLAPLALRICFLTALLSISAVAQEQQFATLGDFKLGSGEVIRDCRIGYRTFGKLNQQKSNAIIFPTWAGGTTEQLKSNIGPGRLVDSDHYFVIAIDALGNGVSASPSNSKLQPRMAFPKFTLRDTVETQHELLTRVLHLDHVKAVVGVSMGGMQTFQWMVAYPDFMDKAVPVVGSPRLATYDLLLWQAQIDAIMNDRDWNNGNYSTNPARRLEYEFGELLLTTPDNYNQKVTREQLFAQLKKSESDPALDANDKIRQAQAMMGLDVSQNFGGSMERAAAAVHAKTFVIVSRFDHVVTPGPAREFARLLHCQTLELDNDCGHLAPSCDSQRVNPAVAAFLADN
ncbi:MAG TPA: alpha/beta fold hydrolase [Pyrinomonadaceae bacterium]|nr:alpha/beta fold hydrolase [Pyrinomonadaceae bacterium]